jgi:hypothetical protein
MSAIIRNHMSDEGGEVFPALQLTDACNKNCTACLRSPDATKHTLSFDDFQAYLGDLRRLSERYRIKHQFITGGEPTLWKDGDKDMVDILAAVKATGIVDTVTMPTNGKVFEDIHVARDLARRISSRIEGSVIVGVSIAGYQKNLDGNGCEALDNLLTVCREPGIKLVTIALVTLASIDHTSETLSRIYPAVSQRVTPLAPMGKATVMKDACPCLSLAGNDKSTVGSYLPHFRKDVTKKLGVSDADFDSMPNVEIMNRLSFFNNCGASFFVKTGWHYCLPFLENPELEMCSIGKMEPETARHFLNDMPFLMDIRAQGVIEAVKSIRPALPRETRDKIDGVLGGEIPVSVAYRGCMVCKQLYDLGAMAPPRHAGATSIDGKKMQQ